ncbi:MAG: HAMP domain-containing sensor histidine kinase [Clostridia bacterium]|nr:HAMP domain-containing sensor histidine kinase [Clostridia bacterium]
MLKNNTKSTENNEKFRGVGIRWNLFAFLAFFIIFVLLVVWIFQVLLLKPFYEDTKMNELKMTASMLKSSIGNDDFEYTAYTLSADYSICIILYEIKDERATEVISCDISSGCIIHHMSSRSFSSFYGKAFENGGEHIEYYSLDAFRRPGSLDKESSSTIYVNIFSDDHGKNYVLFLNSELLPVSTTVKTYMVQFKWIILILLFGALILSVLMSRVISTPIIRLSKSVKRLAVGDYDEVFDGKGYREIKELSDALNYASEELSKNDKLQKELIANVSHDLRTPLTMIRGYSEMMRDIPGENNAENAQIVIDETTRLSELVCDMLDLSKIRAGTRKLNIETFNLTDTVRETMLRYEKLIEKDGYTIKFKCSNDAIVNADKTMMLQVIYNLINNAVNYTGIDKKVTVSLTLDGEKARFAVTDTGDGISPEELPFIWDRYYKVDKVHRRAAMGTGLGLSIVKGILEEHKAVYGVESTVGVGSTFWFEIPAKNSAANQTDT